MCNNYSVVPYSVILCSGFYRVPLQCGSPKHVCYSEVPEHLTSRKLTRKAFELFLPEDGVEDPLSVSVLEGLKIKTIKSHTCALEISRASHSSLLS